MARDLASGQNTLVSRSPGGAVADATAHDPTISGDGAVIAFSSGATNLLGGVGGGTRYGVFARTMATGALSGPPAFGLVDNEPQNRASSPSLSDGGGCMAFEARGHNAFTGAAGDIRTGYVHVIAGECPVPAAAGSPAPAGGQQSKPAITGASLLRKRFRVGKKSTAKRARSPGARGRARRSASASARVPTSRSCWSGAPVGAAPAAPAASRHASSASARRACATSSAGS